MAMIDVEDESILSTIFKDSFPDSWRENPDFAQYLSELSSFGVSQLNREPDRLAEERSQVLDQTQDLAFHNYKTFIQTAECSKEIFQDFQIIEQHVASVLEKLPDLCDTCTTFISRAQEINTSRRMNNLTLQRHTQLLEILEIPQLMDTCVRNEYYEEALELSAHVKRMEKKHTNIPVIMNIVSEVKGSLQLMLNQLIHQLRTNVQLPACLRVIGFLRRMDVFTEPELRIKFLQARDIWFQSLLRGIPTDDPYYHINKTIETSRVHLFDVITQYRAIFSDDDPLIAMTPRDDVINESALFHGWVVLKISQFMATLRVDLSRGVGTRLDSVLGQCMYFGLSFSRVGADFRGLLVPIFQEAALTNFTASIRIANERFDEAMQSYTLLNTPSMLPSSAFTLATQGSGSLQPPVSLLEYQPLAVYCNQVLTALNDLRLCAPLSLASDIATDIQDSLLAAVQVLIAYHRAEEATFNAQDRDRFGALSATFCEDLVPHLNRCLQALFPPTQLAQILGISVVELMKMGNLGLVDAKLIISPIEHLIPEKIVDPAPPVRYVDTVTHQQAYPHSNIGDVTDASPQPTDDLEASPQQTDDHSVSPQPTDDVETTAEAMPTTADVIPIETEVELNPSKDDSQPRTLIQSSEGLVTVEVPGVEEELLGLGLKHVGDEIKDGAIKDGAIKDGVIKDEAQLE